MADRLLRSQVPVEETWNLTDLFTSHEEWERALAAVEESLSTVTHFQGRLGESAAVFLECVKAYEGLYERGMQVYVYAMLHAAGDGSSPEHQAMEGRAEAMFATASAALAFVRTEPLLLPAGTLERYLTEEPGLAVYRKFVEDLLEEKAHMLSLETEIALASLSEVLQAPSTVYNRAKASDIRLEPALDSQGKEHANSLSLYEEDLELNADTTLRRNAFFSFSKGLSAYKNTFAATFATEVKKNVVTAKLRKFPSATHMQLQRHQVSLEAYNNLLDIIQAELAPHMRRYANLRKRVLGMDKMLYCDIEAPLDPGFSPTTSYEEASRMVLESTAVMGPEYSAIIRQALAERWIDRSDNVGKSTGAFCASVYGAHPYVLVTFTGGMRGVFTIAHELGHAAHGVLAERNQTLMNTDVSTFFVEAPSTINELLLGEHLRKQSDNPRLRRWVIMQLLQTYHHNFVRHLLEGELQRRIYALAEQGRPITEATLSGTKGEILKSFWGDTVEIDDYAKLTWMRQPHYYMGLYPYTYSAGLTCATAVAQMIREEGQPAVDRWLTVLKAGGSRKPVELMKMAGVDMTTPAPIRKAIAYVGSLVDELERMF